MLMRRLWNSPTANTWAAFTVRTLNVVLVLPLVLRTFTDAETALWSVFSTLMVFQTVADFGFQATFTRLTAYAFAGARSLTFSREADGEADGWTERPTGGRADGEADGRTGRQPGTRTGGQGG